MSPRMVLLFGMPRSGTTWLGKIFDSHPGTLYRHEPDSVTPVTSVSILPESVNEQALRQLREYSESISRNRALKVVGKTPIFPKRYLSRAAFQRYRAGIAIARFAGRAGVDMPVPWSPVNGNDDTVVVWKSIESLGRLAAILGALPEARALQIVRHPCGYIASVERGEKRGRFGDLSPSSEDFGLMEQLLNTRIGQSWGLSMADIRAMCPEERLAWRWSVFNDKAIEDTRDLPQALSFSYERLCAAPVDVVRSLLEHTGFEWDEQVERFLQRSTSSAETQYYSVFKDPAVAAWQWQDSLDRSKADRIVDVASQSITWKYLGYDQISSPDLK